MYRINVIYFKKFIAKSIYLHKPLYVFLVR